MMADGPSAGGPASRTRSAEAPARRAGAGTSAAPPVSRDEYAAFISSIEIVAIWLVEARIANYLGPRAPDKATARVVMDATLDEAAGGFRCHHSYNLNIEAEDSPAAEISVTFGVQYRSAGPPNSRIFDIFKIQNLPVNTWPYLREFVANAMGRMNWQTLTLPALKRGAPRPPEPAATTTAATEAPRPRRRRATHST